MILISEEKCVGCGACVNDCITKTIEIEENKAVFKNRTCLECGHCVAVCPKNAVSMPNYDMNEVEKIKPANFTGDDLLDVMKSRRSVRQFTNQKVESETLAKLVEVGRYSPTGVNAQNNKFIIIDQELETFRGLVLAALGKQADAMLANENTPQGFLFYANMWKRAHENFLADPSMPDAVFLGAQNLMILSDASVLDVGIAASRIELAAHTYGIGSLYSGFIARACQDIEIKNFLGLTEDAIVPAVLVLGYSKAKYFNTVPRKKANITWK